MEYHVDPLRRKVKSLQLENERLKAEMEKFHKFSAREAELQTVIKSLRDELAGAKMQIGRFRKRNGGQEK